MQHTRVEAPSDDAHFLSLVLVDKEYKVQLSETAIALDDWPGRLSLFAVSNKTGYFAAARTSSFAVAPISALRDGLTSTSSTFPKYVNPLTSTPVSVKFACDGKRFVVCTRDGRLQVFATPTRIPVSEGSTLALPLLYEFTHSDAPIRDVQPNPSDKPETIAVLRGHRDSLSEVEIIDLQTLEVVRTILANPDSATPYQTAICWSPKGKQIAIGDASGQVRHYGTDGSLKSSITPVEEKQPALEVVSILWIENTVSFIVYSNPAEEHEYTTYISAHDTKANTAIDYLLEDPAPPYGLTSRESARSYIHLRSWNPLKHLVIVADAPAEEVGVIGGSDDPKFPWTKLELDETARATVSMDEDGTQLTLVGFDIDLTSRTPISTSTQFDDDSPPLPAAPIIYLYTNDGFVVAYHVLNSETPSYPDMTPMEATNTGEPTPAPVTVPPSTHSAKPSAPPAQSLLKPAFGFGQSTLGAATTFGQTSTTPVGTPAKPNTSAFGQPAFGATSAPLFGQPSGFGSGAFAASKPATGPVGSAAPAFGQLGFGSGTFGAVKPATDPSTSAAPAFGQSGFDAFSNKPASSTPTFGAPSAPGGTGGGFGSFASSGTTGFGLGTTTPTGPPPGTATSSSTKPAAPMPAPSFGASGFGSFASKGTTSFGFGASTSTQPVAAFGTPSSDSPFSAKPVSAFGSTAGAFGGATSGGFGTAKPLSKFGDILPGTGAFGKAAAATPGIQAAASTTPTKPPPEPATKKDDAAAGGPSLGKPTFGSVGFGVSAAIKQPVALQPVKVTAGAGFGGFGSGSGGFSGFAAPAASSGGSFADMLSTGTSKAAPAVKPASITTTFPPSASTGSFAARTTIVRGDEDEKDDEQGASPQSEPGDEEPGSAKRAVPKTAVPNSAFSAMSFGSSLPGPSSATPQLAKPSLFTTIGSTPPASAFSSMSFGTALPGGSASTPSGQRQSAFSSQPPLSSTPTSAFPTMSTLTQTMTIPTGSSEAELSISADGDGTADGSEEDVVEETDEEDQSNDQPVPLEPAEKGEGGEDEESGEEDEELEQVHAPRSRTRSPTLSPVVEADESEELEEPTALDESSYIMPPNPAPQQTPQRTTSGDRPVEPSSPQDEASTPTGSPARPPQSASPSATPRALHAAQSGSALGITTFGSSGGGRPSASALGRNLFSAAPARSSPLSSSPVRTASPSKPSITTFEGGLFGKPIQMSEDTGSSTLHMPQPKPIISVPVTMPLRDVEEERKPLRRSKTPPLSAFGLGFGSSVKAQPTPTGPSSGPPAPLFGAPSFSFNSAKPPSPKIPDGAVPPLMDNIALVASRMKPDGSTTPNIKGKSSPFFSQLSAPAPVTPSPQPPAPKPTGMEAEFAKIIALTDAELQKTFGLAQLSTMMSEVRVQQQSTVKADAVPAQRLSISPMGGFKSVLPKILALEEDVNQVDRAVLEMSQTLLGLKELETKAHVRVTEIDLLIAAQNNEDKKAENVKKQLGPEYEEKQARLRRLSQTVSDRIDQLESFIAEEKRKLDQVKAGKQCIQMPTLEAIGRALNRIQKAGQVKLKQIDFLKERVQALTLDDTDMYGDELVDNGVPARQIASAVRLSSSFAKAPQEPSETLIDAAVALNSERSAKRLRESLLEARPNAPRLNRSAIDKAKKPGQVTMRARMPPTAHLKLIQTLEGDETLQFSAKERQPVVMTSNQKQNNGGTSSLVSKTGNSIDRLNGTPMVSDVFGSSSQALNAGPPNAKPKMEFSFSGGRAGSAVAGPPPRIGPIARQNTRRGFGLHMTED
ncbi:hypothetical protein FRB98_009335 [Tulasnella sp. 332]|nr:hypothetical protein FRB98_009335 [Tulasnella sp. 332]